ncbi:MAG: DotD/TraH family lipoprotein [Planctomycetes bacterium]|nr:DotD/TraH family lipoprotein [Planctomycetota bacterium]|tara:strand:+ start:1512 stop:2054 length:543 start_codon:yes stop_codon:yes gene_type:complete
MERTSKILIAAIFIATLSGCASSPKKIPENTLTEFERQVLEEDRRTNEILSKAAALSGKATAVWVRTNQATKLPGLTAEQIRQARFQNDYIPVNMEQKVEWGWDGAPEPVLRQISMVAGYRLVFTNERPPITKAVTMASKHRMLSEYIDIIDQQTKDYIDTIRVDDESEDKVIYVTYSDF